jgi:hypothetical protein
VKRNVKPRTLCIWAAFVSHFSLPSFSVIESNRRNTCAIDIFVSDDWLEWAAADPCLSDAKPVGEFTVVPDERGEKTPLDDPGPPPPPVPPPPEAEPVAEAKWDAVEGV